VNAIRTMLGWGSNSVGMNEPLYYHRLACHVILFVTKEKYTGGLTGEELC